MSKSTAPRVKYDREWQEWQVWFEGKMAPCGDKEDAQGTARLIAEWAAKRDAKRAKRAAHG
jgi:hypothetical protein